MKICFVTLFPKMIEAPLRESVLGKAAARGDLEFSVVDIRDFAAGKHKNTDDAPYGGGAGMVMKPEPLVGAIEAARERLGGGHVVLLTPQARVFDQAAARRFAAAEKLALVCGRYEGVDERVRRYADEEISLGDFVLMGGEFAALCIADAVARLVPGVLGNATSSTEESHAEGLLEYPQYTRPLEFRGEKVPDVLLSGDHERIRRWRRRHSLLRTREKRPDLWRRLQDAGLAQEDVELLDRDIQ